MGAHSEEENRKYFREQEKKRHNEAMDRYHEEMRKRASESSNRGMTPSTNNGGSSCFVATVAFGDPDCWELHTLRNFRDSSLSKYKMGQAFIRWYYLNGEGLAKWVDKKPRIKRTTKLFLIMFVKYLKKKSY